MNYAEDTPKPKAKSVYITRGIKIAHEWYKTVMWVNRKKQGHNYEPTQLQLSDF